MATTTFCDIKMTEDLENYKYENQSRTWKEGEVVSLPYHTASKLVNRHDVAEWEKSPYEVKQEDYDEVLGVKESSPEVNFPDDVEDMTVDEVEELVESIEDQEFLETSLKYEEEGKNRKGAKNAIKDRIADLEE